MAHNTIYFDDRPQCKFHELDVGQVFVIADEFPKAHMKLAEAKVHSPRADDLLHGNVNAVLLHDGSMTFIGRETVVVKQSATIYLREEL